VLEIAALVGVPAPVTSQVYALTALLERAVFAGR
jgi:hypothetical protein